MMVGIPTPRIDVKGNEREVNLSLYNKNNNSKNFQYHKDKHKV